jgi:hypothetical protein
LLPELIDTDSEGVTVGIREILIPEEVTEAGFAQDSEEIIVHVTISPSASAELVKTAPVSPPTATPFTFH